MVNIHEFKNKLQEYRGGVDYIYDEGKKPILFVMKNWKKFFEEMPLMKLNTKQ